MKTIARHSAFETLLLLFPNLTAHHSRILQLLLTRTLLKMPIPDHFVLNTGAKIPAVGFGTWQAAPHEVQLQKRSLWNCSD